MESKLSHWHIIAVEGSKVVKLDTYSTLAEAECMRVGRYGAIEAPPLVTTAQCFDADCAPKVEVAS